MNESIPSGRRDSASFLVRVWLEPRQAAGDERPLRGVVRNLRTGEERYLADPQKLGEVIRLGLEDGSRDRDEQREAVPERRPSRTE
jgi:hypothetical protein